MTTIDREVTIHANDKKHGMTTAELRAALEHVPDDIVPVLGISISGKIKTIKVKVRVVTDALG